MNVPESSITRYFRVDRRDLVYLKFILEAYEGLSTMSTANQKEGIVKIVIPDWAVEDMAGLLASLATEIRLSEVHDQMEGSGA